MEIVEVIKTRKSVRGFLPKPVPQPVLEEMLALAGRSPSWANTQPWEVTVIGGEVMEQLKAALVQAMTSGTPSAPDLPYPRFDEPYLSRARDSGRRTQELLGIGREDKEKRDQWTLKGYRFFDAPNGLIFCLDEKLAQWSLLDLGLFIQSLILVAWSLGLGTCPLAAVAGYPQVLRSTLGIPDNKKITYGMALGYPDWPSPVNKRETPREPLSNFTRWCGF